MLGVLRRNKNNPLIVVVLGLVVLLMMAFGISVQGVSTEGDAAEVNGEPIKETVFSSAYARQYRMKQSQDRRYDRKKAEAEDLRQQVLDQLIVAKILAQDAQRRGLEVDDQALREAILDSEQFQTEDGQFSREQYERWVNYMGVPERTFEENERERLLAQTLTAPIEGLGVSDEEIREAFEWENTKVNIEFIEVPKDELAGEVEAVTDADVEAFRSREDAQEKIQAYYKRNKSKKYDVPKKVCAQHILVRADDSVPPDILKEKKTQIEKAGKAIAGGMDFTEAAKKFSEDANKAKGGDLGCFSEGETQPQLAQAAFSLKPGEVSPVVKTPFGFHIVKVNEIKDPVRKKLEEVEGEIARELAKADKAGSIAKRKAEALAAAAKDAESLAAVVEAKQDDFPFELKADTTGPFPRGREFLPKLGLAKDVSKAAWALTEDAPVAGPIETDRAWVVIRLLGREEPKDSDFEAQRLGIAYRLISGKQSALQDKWYGMLKTREKVMVDPIAVSYSDEAEQIRNQRRTRRR